MADRKQQGQQAPQGTAMQEDAGLVALDQLTTRLDALTTRLEALEQAAASPAPAPVPSLAGCLAMLADHRRARDGLLLWAKRTQGSSQGPLVDWMRQAMGLEA